MIGNLPDGPLARQIFLAGDGVRKDGGQQIFGFHPLDLRRHLFPVGETQQGERP